MNSKKPTPEDYKNWQNDPNNWYLGIFYYNPKDDRLWLPKKIEWMGYTTNFANPYSFLIIITILSFIPLLILLK